MCSSDLMRTLGATRRNQQKGNLPKVLQTFLVITRVGPSIRTEHFWQQIGLWSLTNYTAVKTTSFPVKYIYYMSFFVIAVLAGHAASSEVTQ